MKSKILIYGAAGYMGRLFAQHAKAAKLPFVLGSRESFKTNEELRIFSLENTRQIEQQLADIKVVVNLAGPFANTQQPLVEACIATQTHYADIAGEYPEFESVYRFAAQAQQAGVMLMPGAGFGVVPTDIAATLAVQKLPDATHLKLAYLTVGGASRGTLKTVLKDINKAGVRIVEGRAVPAKPAQSDFRFEAKGQRHRVVYNPWRGDLFTAQLSTGVVNIETYANFPGFVESMMHGRLLWLRDLILKRFINFFPVGPSAKDLQKGKTIIHAEVSNAKGHKAHVSLEGPEAYLFTAHTLVGLSRRILNDEYEVGFQTPSVYGSALIAEVARIS